MIRALERHWVRGRGRVRGQERERSWGPVEELAEGQRRTPGRGWIERVAR